MYTARIVATDTINATTFLNYLQMADPINVLLHNETSFSNKGTSRSCPLSIPSPDDVNCTMLSVNSPVDNISNKNGTSNSESGDSDKSSDNNDEGDSIATVIAVAVGCSVGIVAMAIFVMFTMFVCNRCSRCHNHDSR